MFIFQRFLRNNGRLQVCKGNVSISDVMGHMTQSVFVGVKVAMDISAYWIRETDISRENEAYCFYNQINQFIISSNISVSDKF